MTEGTKYHYLYRITNKINGKIYIGQTIDYIRRWYEHKRAARSGKSGQIISYAIAKHGEDNFKFEIIATCRGYDDVNFIEEELIKQYDCLVSGGKGYNISLGGETAPKTEEWKKKVSQSLMGHSVSDETKEKLSKANIGKIISDETREKISLAMIGRDVSKDTRKKLSEINKGNTNCLGKQNALGYCHTDKAKEKIGAAFRGKTNLYCKGKSWKIVNGKRKWQLYYSEEEKKKECSVCHDIKEFDNFYSQKKARYGLSSSCRDCLNLAKKKKRGTLEKTLLLDDNKKKCSKCGEVKDFELFNKRTDGELASWCKGCYNEYRREKRLTD